MGKTTISLILVCIFLSSGRLSAQQAGRDSSARALAVANARYFYQDFIAAAAPLYISPEYVEYTLQIDDGHPFFINSFFHMGTVMYDNILFEDVLLKYDLVLNQLVLSDTTGIPRLALNYDRIKYFTIKEHEFVKLFKDAGNSGLPQTDFYEILHKGGPVTLIKKETKKIGQDVTSKTTLQRYIIATTNYYIRKKNTWYVFNKRGQILDAFNDKESQIRQFLRKNDIDFKKDADLLSVVSYYESLSR